MTSVTVPKTQGIKYAGSKLKLLGHILALASEVPSRTVLDGFSGTTRVSQAFAKSGYSVTCSDISEWSEIFGRCYLQAGDACKYHELIQHLNSCPPKDGWFTECYGGIPDDGNPGNPKRPWQVHNTRKLDAIREEIDMLSLSDTEKSVALTSLILALDKVDNTLGHFTSYLKKWSARSYNNLQLQVPDIGVYTEQHTVTRGDIFDVLPRVRADLSYFDPPYGSNNEKMPPSRVRYAAYYHIWKTIILNDQPGVFGSANRREDSRDHVSGSVFEEFRKNDNGKFFAVTALGEMLRQVDTEFIILSYSSGGRATAEELYSEIDTVGNLRKVVEIDYQRNVMADMRWTNEWVKGNGQKNTEFLFLIEKL
ncbi:MAG: DNA adenine methylase [Rhodobacteraceae bacterium]|nr:DNA adenine methylase [Paracoccaceae bacterium]